MINFSIKCTISKLDFGYFHFSTAISTRVFLGYLVPFFGHFWPFLAVFGHFWPKNRTNEIEFVFFLKGLFRFIDLRGLYQDLRITSHSCVIVKLNMQHLRSAVFESDLQWRCSIILRVMLLQWNVGNVPSRRHRRRRAAEFRAQSNDAVHTVSFTAIYLIYLGNHTNSLKWADFFTCMKMLFNVTSLCHL